MIRCFYHTAETVNFFLFTAHLISISQWNDCASEKRHNALENNYTLEGVQRVEENEITKLSFFFNNILGTAKKK
jgi:hypothetical protein